MWYSLEIKDTLTKKKKDDFAFISLIEKFVKYRILCFICSFIDYVFFQILVPTDLILDLSGICVQIENF